MWPRFLARIWKCFFWNLETRYFARSSRKCYSAATFVSFLSSCSRKWNFRRETHKKSFVHNILIPNFAPNLQNRFLPHQGSRTGQEPSATVESEFKIQDANIFALTYFQNFCLHWVVVQSKFYMLGLIFLENMFFVFLFFYSKTKILDVFLRTDLFPQFLPLSSNIRISLCIDW